MELKKRRAVGGLISLIGIIVVFGISSVAYLEISSSQTNLINQSLEANQKISDKNNARLNFTNIVEFTNDHYDLTLDNIGSDTATVHSYIINRNNVVIDKGEINSSINAGNERTITVNSATTQPASDIIMIVTDLGKKCIVPADVSYRIC
ncbi:hypothetical protein [Candidatus Nitrosopumilus sediminis]|uniref:Uncharacterized protein n=1 Tax=Candidatus Nitrosopumilus sediminis TaxID=1229909 RepID=K0B9W0_9ARCH|nr:hypothetical protein [Candidatus Nitrosopumilus sediminis]AFS82978.1 hypothetical protein NSED_05880 [Candidatus Nitrosopumilus sediminis]